MKIQLWFPPHKGLYCVRKWSFHFISCSVSKLPIYLWFPSSCSRSHSYPNKPQRLYFKIYPESVPLSCCRPSPSHNKPLPRLQPRPSPVSPPLFCPPHLQTCPAVRLFNFRYTRSFNASLLCSEKSPKLFSWCPCDLPSPARCFPRGALIVATLTRDVPNLGLAAVLSLLHRYWGDWLALPFL
jgi:hypothetical protein